MAQRKKYEEIADFLELKIFTSGLKVDDKLPSERDLMTQFGAGRSSVREAIFALQRKGLVSARAGTAARVTRPTADSLVSELSGAARHLLSYPEGIRDLQNARMLLEVGLARSAALNATPEDVARLKAALDANRGASDAQTFQASDMLFHYTLAQISHNQVFTALNMALNNWLAEQRRISSKAGVSFDAVYIQHEAVFLAIQDRDPIAAEIAMEAHLESVMANYWTQVAGA